MKNTKRALGISLLALLLCVSMFVGTTFAWFTDSVTVAGNKIQAGTLDIELWQNFYGSEYDNSEDVNITDSKEPLFNHDNWEPGYLDFVNLTVKNVGSLAVKIKANLIATSEIGKLAEVIDVYVVRYPLSKDPYSAWGTPSSFTVRDLIEGFEFEPYIPAMGSDYYSKLVTKVGTLKDVLEQGLDLMPEQIIEANKGDQSNYQINIALKMREEAGNEYQGETAGTFDIRILAAQATVESDSFDNQYDKDAEWPIHTQAELDAALANAQAGDTLYLTGGVYRMNGANSKNNYEGLTIVGDGATVIDSVNGFTGCTFENVIVNDIYTLENTTMINCKIVAPVSDVACATQLNGDAKFVGCQFTANGKGTSLWFDAVVDGAKATFENCTFVDNIRLGGDDTNAYTFTGCNFLGGNVNWSKALIITYAPITLDTCTFTIEEPALYGVRVAVGMTAGDVTLINTTTPVMVP